MLHLSAFIHFIHVFVDVFEVIALTLMGEATVATATKIHIHFVYWLLLMLILMC